MRSSGADFWDDVNGPNPRWSIDDYAPNGDPQGRTMALPTEFSPMSWEDGGYPDLPLMEDVALARAIGKSRLTLLSAEARTSAAKYERDGWRKRAYANAWLLGRYLMGASPERLARHYT